MGWRGRVRRGDALSGRPAAASRARRADPRVIDRVEYQRHPQEHAHRRAGDTIVVAAAVGPVTTNWRMWMMRRFLTAISFATAVAASAAAQSACSKPPPSNTPVAARPPIT